MSANLQTYKVVNGELSSPTKQNNMIQTIEDALNAILVAQISPTGASSGNVVTYNGSSVVWAAAASASAAGSQIDRKTVTSDVGGIVATTEGTAAAVITGNSVAYDGTEVKVEFWCPEIAGAAANIIQFVVFRDAALVGQAQGRIDSSGATGSPVKIELFDTPTAASHVYSVKAYVNAGTGTVKAGAGGAGALLPMWLRVTKA